jgi:hypothetical protein
MRHDKPITLSAVCHRTSAEKNARIVGSAEELRNVGHFAAPAKMLQENPPTRILEEHMNGVAVAQHGRRRAKERTT